VRIIIDQRFSRVWLIACGALLALTSGCISSFDPDSVELDRDGAADAGVDTPPQNDTAPDAACPEGDPCEFGQPGVVAQCMEGVCTAVECEASVANCDDDFSNGCEVALTEPATCGACDTVCEGLNAVWACDDLACAVDDCAPGFADVDGEPTNGCESALLPTPTITAIESRNHGMRVTWDVPEAETPIDHLVVAWGPTPEDLPNSRTVLEDGRGAAVVGPVQSEGTVFVTVTAGAGQGEAAQYGAPSDAVPHEFVPAGWFQSHTGRFWTGGRYSAENGGLAIALGHVVFMDRDGAAIPSRLPRPRPVFDIDVDDRGRAAVVSSDGFVAVSQNHGVGWVERRLPRGDEDYAFAFGVAIVDTGRVITCGSQVTQSDTFGGVFDIVTPPPGIQVSFYYGTDRLEDGDAQYVFCAGSGSDWNLVVAWTPDRGESWQFSTPQLDLEERVEGGIAMVSPTTGFVASKNGLYRTDDQWNTAQFIRLNEGEDDSLFRIQFDADGFGVATSKDSPGFYMTEDSGDSWDRHIDIGGRRSAFLGLMSLGSEADNGFFVMGADGRILNWNGPRGQRTVDTVREAAVESLVGVFTDGDEVVAVGSQGGLYRSTEGPEGLRARGAISENGDVIYAAEASGDGSLFVAAGAEGQMFTSRNRGLAWNLVDIRGMNDLVFADVAVDGSGNNAVAVGRGLNGFSVVELRDNPSIVAVSNQSDIDPDLGVSNLQPVAVAISGDGGLVVVAMEGGNRDVFYLGQGAPDREWERVELDLRAEITDVALIRASREFYVVGRGGLFVKVDPEGSPPETRVAFPLPAGVQRRDLRFVGVTFPGDGLNGWAFTEDGWVFATTDGGATWAIDRAVSGSDVFEDDLYPNRLRKMWVEPDLQHAAIVGSEGTFVWTANGGVPNPPID
jgi:photosystem II stability/assembly factor-like uncharacterized protein